MEVYFTVYDLCFTNWNSIGQQNCKFEENWFEKGHFAE